MRAIIEMFKKPKALVPILVIFAVIIIAVWRVVAPMRSETSLSKETSGMARGDYYGDIAGEGQPWAAPAVAPSQNARMAYPVDEDGGTTAAEVDQKIIKTGSLDLLVKDVASSAVSIGKIAVARKGYIQSSSVSEGGGGAYIGTVVVRVPVDVFEAAIAEFRNLATLVRNETSNGQDVTEQYTDLEAQLRNAKAQEEVYLGVLKQAKNVSEILDVQEHLGAIRAQIESLEGRVKYLTNMTSYSTISVLLSEEPSVRAPTKEFRPLAIVKAAFQTLVIAIQTLIAGLIWFVIVWGGILLPLGLIIWLFWRHWKKSRTQQR